MKRHYGMRVYWKGQYSHSVTYTTEEKREKGAKEYTDMEKDLERRGEKSFGKLELKFYKV